MKATDHLLSMIETRTAKQQRLAVLAIKTLDSMGLTVARGGRIVPNRAPSFAYLSDLKLNAGDSIAFTESEFESIKATIVDDRRILFAGTEFSLSRLTDSLLGLPLGGHNGDTLKYWRAPDGRLLSELRDEIRQQPVKTV